MVVLEFAKKVREEHMQYPENDPRHHTTKIKNMLNDTARACP